MGKKIAGFLGVLASIAGILGLLVALNIIQPFPGHPTPTPPPGITPTPEITPTPPTLIVSSLSIKAKTDCSFYSNSFVSTYTCYEALSLSGKGSLNWAASGGAPGTQFNPQQGTLKPGQSVIVKISVPVRNIAVIGRDSICPTIANLIFTNKTNPTNTLNVLWSC